MKLKKQHMIADMVKGSRTTKGYTQKELSDISKISLRSIQRIENGEVVPRMYTLKTLANCLDFSLDFLNEEEEENNKVHNVKGNRERKIILSIGSGVVLLFLAWGYIAQSSTFPETGFELLLYCALIVALYTVVLLVIWQTSPKKQH